MSLFKVCTWWTVQCPDFQANYDCYSLHCCRLALKENEKDYIVVGSHTGFLSIFRPLNEAKSENAGDGFNASDLVLEMKLSSPIIGILAGRFIGSHNERLQLAVLHPMKLCIFNLQTTEGVADHGNQSKLEVCVEHKFQRFAFSFCKGHFGGVKGKEFLCVTFMDSTLGLFEQDGISYECKLSGERNIPTVFQYVPRIDSFVTISSGSELQCFRYQDFCQSVESLTSVQTVWNLCIGEYALDLSVHQITNDESIIMILGENNLIAISDSGIMKFIKRLDYSPVCFHSFVIGWYWEPNARLISAVVSESGSLLIYEDAKLLWAAQLNDVPVAIQRSNLDGLAGSIVTLSAMGILTVGYLGSDPNLFKVPPLNLSEFNYEKIQKEIVELEKEIQAGIDFTDISLANSAAERELQLKLSISGKLEKCFFPTKINNSEIEHKMCLVSLSIKRNPRLEQVQVYFDVPLPLKCSKPLHVFTNFSTDEVNRFDTWVYIEEALPICSAVVKVLISFTNNQSISRVLERQVLLPFAMFYKQCQPQKEAEFKITISAEDGLDFSLTTLLAKEIILDGNVQAIGLKSTHTDSVITIVEAKSSNKLRIQSNDFHGLAMVVELIVERVKCLQEKNNEINKEESKEPLKIFVYPQIQVNPVAEFYEEHYNCRIDHIRCKKNLEILSGQMRLIQRRLLLKIENKKIGALENVILLLKYTQKQLIESYRKLEQCETNLRKAQANLSCAIYILRLAVKHFDLPHHATDGLCAVLIGPVTDWMDQSWEDVSAPGFDMLNRIGPLKKSKSTALDDNPSFASTQLDINRFKKHFSSLLERVCRLASKDTSVKFLEDKKDTLEETIEEETEQSEWLNDLADTKNILQ